MSRLPTIRSSDLSVSSLEEAEYVQMEQWLDDHPSFIHDYFARKATRSMIDGWFISRAVQSSMSAGEPGSSREGHRAESTPPTSSSHCGSGANTPVRKVSASEFGERGPLGPMFQTTEDGLPSFLNRGSSKPPSPPRQRKSINELRLLDDREVLIELVHDITDELELTSLCHKILQNVSVLTRADRCSLFLVEGQPDTQGCQLASKLFDVSSQSTLEGSLKEEVRVPWGKGIVGYVAKTGEPVNIANAYEDPRFNCEVDLKTGYKTKSILCMPIIDCNSEVVGVAQVINKTGSKDKEEAFSENDKKVFSQYLRFCGIGIRNAQLFEKSQLEIKRNQVLLDLVRILFEEQTTLATIVYRIMMYTVSLLQCDRCSVLLVDHQTSKQLLRPQKKRHRKEDNRKMGIFSQVFEFENSELEDKDNSKKCVSDCPRFPINVGITRHVAATGETLNIPDAYQDSRFDPKVDQETGYRTKQILCMPIKATNGAILGVIQLVNKMDGKPFNRNDEDWFEAFAIFCGMGIHNTQVYEKMATTAAKHRVALEVLSYHATAPMSEALRLKKMTVPTVEKLRLSDYSFSDFHLNDDQTMLASLRMFMDLNLIDIFHINFENLCRWLLSVRKNYRNVIYHNWRHAFNVAQTMFSMIKAAKLQQTGLLTNKECLALIVASLSHDLDHRGTNNSFQIRFGTPLAELYTTSTMEFHHLDQCIMILNSKGNEILNNLSPEDYTEIIHLLEHAILATDLAIYFRTRGDFFGLVNNLGKTDWKVDDNREILRGMMMTACDVAATTKPWNIQKQVAEMVAGEFFEQGDMERQTLHTTPIDLMNREKKDLLPQLQVDFIDSICLPVYKSLSQFNENFEPLFKGCMSNKKMWEQLQQGQQGGSKQQRPKSGEASPGKTAAGKSTGKTKKP